MRKTFTLWAFIGSLFMGTAFAQAPHRTCGTLEAEAAMEKADPGYKTRKLQNEAAISKYLSNPANRNKTQATKTIPVVFHVVYNTAAQNISAAQIQSQMDILNRDFRRMNADTANTPNIFRVLGADTQIEFCLASVDPSGQPTTGITRTSTTVSSFSVSSPNVVKTTSQGGKDPWPRDQYLNIWVCNMGGGILGYATPPGGPAASDGVVLLYSSVGAPPANPFTTAAPYNKGRTATHEVGHWFNLKHIWGDEPACAADDLVTDTPLQKGENYGCPTFPVANSAAGGACPGSDTNGPMFMNYMDYVDDDCMNMFTKGQRDRMAAAIATSRPTLLTSTACANTLTANFSASATSIPSGTSINFTDLSVGAPTGWSWSFPGATPNTSTVQNPTNIRYNTPGVYPVTLTITKGTATHTRTFSNYITVINGSNCSDTLGLPFTGTPTLYVSSTTSGKNGFVSGNNGYGDKAKAEYFATTGGFNQINGALLRFGKAKAASGSSNVTVTVWNNAGANGSPGTILGSKVVSISSIAADVAANQLTSVTFTTPIKVNGPYYVGVQLSSTPGDTVALVTNTNGNAAAGKGWEQLSNNTWATYTSSWNLNISNAIFPVVTTVAPVVDFTPATATACLGTPITFNSGLTTGAVSYLWSFPGGTPSTSTSPNPTVIYTQAGNWNVTLKATSGACGLSTTLTKPFAITAVASPTVSVTPGASQTCGPVPVTLTATGATTYTWYPATGLNTTSGASVIANPTATTIYNVIGTTSGCSDTAQVVVAVTNVTSSFTANPTVVDLKTGGTVNFTNTSSSNALFFNWNFGDPAAGALNTSTVKNPPAFTYTRTGTYTVTLIAASGSSTGNCQQTSTFNVLVRNTTGLEEAYDNGMIKIYPNPAKSFLQVEVPERSAVTEIQLTNAVGQVIASQKPVAGQARLNVSNLSNGIYFVRITNAEGSIIKKVSVMQ